MSDYYFSIPLYHVDLKENNELFIEEKKFLHLMKMGNGVEKDYIYGII